MGFGWGDGSEDKRAIHDEGEKIMSMVFWKPNKKSFKEEGNINCVKCWQVQEDEKWKWIIAFHSMKATGALDRNSFSEIVSGKPN